jgi:uncharacterized protein YecE (DUF72 family)
MPEVIHIGCAGWNIPRQSIAHFEREGTHLERYSRTFNCCEINSSFYRPHRYSTWERWSASVPKEFRFSVKVPRTITHDAELNCRAEELSVFLKEVSFLGQKLGPLLLQLPPCCAFNYIVAKRFFALLRERHPGDVVLEARHGSWFDTEADDLLKKFTIAGVAADPACVPLAREPNGHREVSYFRLHGSPRRYYSPYPNDFLKAIARRIVDLAKAARVWCIFDNTAAGFAVPNALELSGHIAKTEAANPEAPS